MGDMKLEFDVLARIFAKAHKGQFGGFKKARKAFYSAHKHDAAEKGKERLDLSLWDLSSYNKKCKNHCDNGINGYLRVRKDTDGNWVTTPVVCACVKSRSSTNEENHTTGAAPTPSVDPVHTSDDKKDGHGVQGSEDSR